MGTGQKLGHTGLRFGSNSGDRIATVNSQLIDPRVDEGFLLNQERLYLRNLVGIEEDDTTADPLRYSFNLRLAECQPDTDNVTRGLLKRAGEQLEGAGLRLESTLRLGGRAVALVRIRRPNGST